VEFGGRAIEKRSTTVSFLAIPAGGSPWWTVQRGSPSTRTNAGDGRAFAACVSEWWMSSISLLPGPPPDDDLRELRHLEAEDIHACLR
jgi:hypothetical protein